MTAAAREDLHLLSELLDEHADELSEVETEAFTGMRAALTATDGQHRLTEKQRAWVRDVRERFVPQYENLVSRGLVPRGREVETPAVLQNLPKRPPTKRSAE